MKIAITGASGLVGKACTQHFKAAGHEVLRFVRTQEKSADAIGWDPATGFIDAAKLEGIDVVINLAGDSIAGGRWSEEKKRRIRDSRIQSTRLLSQTLTTLKAPPQLLISASAIGYYGSRGDEELTEKSSSGQGFLASVCREWEAATQPASDRGIRVVHPRFGVILSPKGGALATMLTPFKLGLGGVIGSGKQWMSWVALEDVVRIFDHIIHNKQLSGALNTVSPTPVTNRTFTKDLGEALHRPTFLPLPAFAARLILGEMGEELLLTSQRVTPTKLLETDYSFVFPELNQVLKSVNN